MNRGIVIKRAQYSKDPVTGRRNKRIKLPEDLTGLMAYLESADHANHDGIELRGVRFWRTTEDQFLAKVLRQSVEYQADAKEKPGRRWAGDIAEHLIAAPDEGADLTTDEEDLMLPIILSKVAPESPAVYGKHFNPLTKRSEFHIIPGSFTEDFPARLRTTSLRSRFNTDYLLILQEAGEEALSAINRARGLAGRPLIRSLGSIRARVKDEVVSFLCDCASEKHLHEPSQDDVVALLEASRWTMLKRRPRNLSLQSKETGVKLHIRWQELIDAVRHVMALERLKLSELTEEAQPDISEETLRQDQSADNAHEEWAME